MKVSSATTAVILLSEMNKAVNCSLKRSSAASTLLRLYCLLTRAGFHGATQVFYLLVTKFRLALPVELTLCDILGLS